jgi:hypothetical protein
MASEMTVQEREICVVVSLVYLVTEIRQNTNSTKAASYRATDFFRDLRELDATHFGRRRITTFSP